MKKIIACPAGEWAKRLFTIERFEKIDCFLGEKEGEFECLGTSKKINSYDYLRQIEKEEYIVIIADSKKYEELKIILEKYGFVKDKHFFNGWKLSHEFYENYYEDKAWIEFEKGNKNALSNMRKGWEKRHQKMVQMIPSDVKSVLDVGCGEGILKRYLPKDIVYYGLDYCERECTDYICDINNDCLPNVDVDMIYMGGIIEYIDDIKKFISQLSNYQYVLVSKRRTETFIRLDNTVCDGYLNYGIKEYYLNDLINDMFAEEFVCTRIEWPYKERDEYYALFRKMKA